MRNISNVHKTGDAISSWQINRAILLRKITEEILHERIWPQEGKSDTGLAYVLFIGAMPFRDGGLCFVVDSDHRKFHDVANSGLFRSVDNLFISSS